MSMVASALQLSWPMHSASRFYIVVVAIVAVLLQSLILQKCTDKCD